LNTSAINIMLLVCYPYDIIIFRKYYRNDNCEEGINLTLPQIEWKVLRLDPTR